MRSIEKRLLILWFALAFVVWNGVYDMRMHDTVRGYLLEAALAQAGLGAASTCDRSCIAASVDAVAFSTAWALGVFLAGVVTMWTYRRYIAERTPGPAPLAPLAPRALMHPLIHDWNTHRRAADSRRRAARRRDAARRAAVAVGAMPDHRREARASCT